MQGDLQEEDSRKRRNNQMNANKKDTLTYFNVHVIILTLNEHFLKWERFYKLSKAFFSTAFLNTFLKRWLLIYHWRFLQQKFQNVALKGPTLGKVTETASALWPTCSASPFSPPNGGGSAPLWPACALPLPGPHPHPVNAHVYVGLQFPDSYFLPPVPSLGMAPNSLDHPSLPVSDGSSLVFHQLFFFF